MKKLLALCLTVIMVISMFSVVASAATINVAAKTLMNQSFTGSAVPTGWEATAANGTVEFSGTALVFTPAEGDVSKNVPIFNSTAYNAGGKDYTVIVETGHYDGNSYIHFGADTKADAVNAGASETGYTLSLTNKNGSVYTHGVYKLYLNGIEMGTVADPGNNFAHQNIREFKFDVTSTGVTVSIGGTQAAVLSNPEGTTTDYSGYFGYDMVNNSGYTKPSKLALVNITTVASSYDINVTEPVTGGYILSEAKPLSQKFYDDSTGTAVKLDAAPTGWSIITGNNTFTTAGISWTNNGKKGGIKTSSAIDVGSSDYEVEFKVIHNSNYLWMYSCVDAISTSGNGKESASGYSIHADAKNKKIELFIDGAKVSSNTSAGYTASADLNKTFKLVVSNGKVKVYYNGTEVCSGDDATPATSGLFGAYVAYSTKVVVSSINATTSSKKASFLLDKKFSSETDTLASLGTDGFNLTNIDSVGTNGLVGKTDKKQSIKFTTKFGGVYTAELEGIIGWKPVHFRVNVNDDGTSYYDIYNDAGTLMIDKVTADSTTTLSSKTAQSTYLSEDNTLKYIVSLAPQDTGDMNIDVTAMINDAVIDTLSATDAAVDVPLTDGYVQYYSEYSKSTIKSMKVYPGVTPVSYTGDFYVNGTTTAAKGHTIMTFPVAMLGQTPDVIAALYEDGKVTDVEFINIADLNNKGYAELFDTASSTANKVNVKVFIWDTLEGLIPVTEAFSLVK